MISILLQAYGLELNREGKSPRTTASYLAASRHFIRFVTGLTGRPFRPRFFKLSYLRAYRDNQISIGLKPSTINCRLTALTSWGRFLVQSSILRKNPAASVNRVKPASWQQKPLLPLISGKARLELAAYLARPVRRLTDLRNRCLVEIALKTGMSTKKLMNLQLNQICYRRGRPAALITGRRIIRLELSAPDLLDLYLGIRNLQKGTMLFKGYVGPGRGLSASSINRILMPVRKAIFEIALAA